MAPSSFASALAGNSHNESASREGGSSEWSRSRTNGATHTFRRSSTAVSSGNISTATHFHDSTNTAIPLVGPGANPSPRYVPPHRNGTAPDMRYSKDQLLDLFRAQHSSDDVAREDLSAYYVGLWRPDVSYNGAARTETSRDAHLGPDVCWDKEGTLEPLGLVEMDDDERELFITSVNTPLKPPSSATKDGHQSNGLGGRKFSVTGQGGASANPGLMSPTAARGTGRRRETSESYPFPVTAGRDEQRAPSPPPSLLRRTTDLKDISRPSDHDEGDEKTSWSPFGTLKRHATGPLSAGVGGPASPWSNTPATSGISPMGSFGNFGLGQQGAPAEKRPGLGSGRPESRFKNLLSRDGGDEPTARTVERKSSISGLARVNENESWRPIPDRTDPLLDETEEDLPSGSAALAADPDNSPQLPHQRHGFGTPGRIDHRDDFAFGAFGMTSDNTHGFVPAFSQGRDAFGHPPPQNRPLGGNEPMSPTDTNPYQSPDQNPAERGNEDEHPSAETHNAHLSGLGGFGADPASQFATLGGLGALPNLGRGPGQPGDRSQTGSTGPNKAFAGLGGLGHLGGMPGAHTWPINQTGLVTPTRQPGGGGMPSPFGSGFYGPDAPQPNLAGLGAGAGFGGSRMAGMFPPAAQDQMPPSEQERMSGRLSQHFSGLGDHQRTHEAQFAGSAAPGAPGGPDEQSNQPQGQPGPPPQDPSALPQPSGQAVQAQGAMSNQLPAPQQRTMVMPDRMRWIYRDPQGQTQGPWSGLEMHDWYKAGFFSPELLVKKLEEPDYEPLAQLIRRIGNSREPFLVPQIGIPHGQASNNGPNAWAGTSAVPGSSTAATGAQPPFASSFPSFGTTLTAEQQNALERRKQEEQYLMARQKEHLAQAQMAQRMQHHPMQPGAMPGVHGNLAPGGQLHHQHSGQSLHTQPSFGSMTGPSSGGYQPSPAQPPQPHGQGFYDNTFRAQGQSGGLGAIGGSVESHGHVREEDVPGLMNRLSVGNRPVTGQFGSGPQHFAGQQVPPQQQPGLEMHEQQVQQMLQDRARIQHEQALHDAQSQHEEDDQGQRLKQFRELQSQEAEQSVDTRFQAAPGKRTSKQQVAAELAATSNRHAADLVEQPGEQLTLTEQVQKAASAQQSPAPAQPGFPQPFPPPPSQSPLPAPAAQRTGRQSVADQLQSEQRDSSLTPSIEAPTVIAPWAKDQLEAPKGPSLKEIQEIEAKRAAEAEELASAARRAAFQREMEAQAQAQAQAALAAAAQGLPAAAKWAAAGGSPSTPTSGAAWSKAAQKPTTATPAKTMAQIQKEEEARKKRAAANAVRATAATNITTTSGGKSYANLASKVSSSPTPPAAGGAWTTVGASGKTKTPVAAAAAAAAAPVSRTVSSSAAPSVATSASAAARKTPARSVTLGGSTTANAQDEFKKWALGELRPDLNKGISAEEFVAGLVFLPPDTEIITEAVHGVSSTIDSRHFAEEFVRRKRLADKGLVDSSIPLKSASPHNAAADRAGAGGWSEVAKKGPLRESSAAMAAGTATAGGSREEANGNFRVVAAKKKGGKR